MEATLRPASATTKRGRLPYVGALDGLRAACLIAVLCYHGGLSWADGGFLGVSTFFTLSGFLITALMLVEVRTTGRVALGRFWAARARRLLPAAALMYLLVVALSRLGATTSQLGGLRQDLWASFGLGINWRLALSGRSYGASAAASSPVQHLWSLAVEEQFYLVLPLFVAGAMVVARRSGRNVRVVLGVAAAALAVLSTVALLTAVRPGGDVTWAYYATHTRAAELLAGVVLACVVHRLVDWAPRRKVVPVAGAIAGIAILGAWVGADQAGRGLYRGGLSAYTLASVVVIVACLYSGPVRSVLDTGPLRELGKISYGAYLYHWPIFSWLRPGVVGDLDGYPLFALRVAVTLVVAWLSATYVEMPIRQRRLLPRMPPPVLAGTVLVALALTLVVPWRVIGTGPSGVEVADGARVEAASGGGEPIATTGTTEPDAPQVERMLLVGDSILEQLAPYVAEALPAIDVRFIGGGGIGPLTDQAALAVQLTQQIEELDPDVVVFEFAGNYLRLRPEATPYYLPDGTKVGDASDLMYDVWATETQRLVDVAGERGATVVWALAPTVNPTSTFGFLSEGIPRLNDGYRRLVGATLLDWHALTAGPDGAFVDDLADPDGRVEDGRDDDGLHFTAFGNRILAATLAEEVAAWPGRPEPEPRDPGDP